MNHDSSLRLLTQELVDAKRDLSIATEAHLAVLANMRKSRAWHQQIMDGCDGFCALDECVCVPPKAPA